MKKFLSVFILLLFLFLFAGCSGKNRIEFYSGEIVYSEKTSLISITVQNKTGEKIKNLSVTALTDDGEKHTGKYPIEVEPDGRATLSINGKMNCKSVKVISFSYDNQKGKTFTGEFGENAVVKPRVKSDGETVVTRESLAEKIIIRVRDEFLKKRTYSQGQYDPEKKILYVYSQYPEDYDYCYDSYQKDPTAWKSLEDGVVKMSSDYLSEFKNNGFDDVTVSIGVMSSDEKIIVSASNGELIDTLSSENS